MSGRATKSGLALESQTKIQSKFDSGLSGEILGWIDRVSGAGINTSGDMDNFCAVLKDGTVLCKLANALKPESIRKINDSKMAFKQMENIGHFLKFAEEVGGIGKNESFMTVDLYEGQDPNSVLVTIAALARRSEKVFGVPGLGPKESEKQTREWTAEQLKAGDGIIGLQVRFFSSTSVGDGAAGLA